jgi:hypothetical protein
MDTHLPTTAPSRHVPPEELPLSRILDEALSGGWADPVTVGGLAERLEERGFGLLIILLSLVTVIPVLPPGSAAAVGLLYVVGGLQMAAGRRRPWLPRRVSQYQLPARAVEGLRSRGVPFLRRVERFSRPRWTPFSDQALLRLASVVVLLMGVVLFLPLPFLNTLPGLAMLAVGIGLMNRDGVFLLLGTGLAAAVLVLAGLGFEALRALVRWVLTWRP